MKLAILMKIFLYYEENDFYERCLKKKKPIYLIENSKINHKGNSSTLKIFFKEEVEINRNWHLMWSTFYFYKKHFGKVIAYKKILPNFFSAFNILFSQLQIIKKKKIYSARFSGIFNSIIGNKSWFRPDITKK